VHEGIESGAVEVSFKSGDQVSQIRAFLRIVLISKLK
jgi:hypothetical protein